MSWQVLPGDCIERLAGLDEASVDAIVTDPPYGLEFMGKEWDSFKTGRSAKYSSGGEIDRENIAARKGKGGAGPSYVKRPAKRCAKCGKQAWSGSPCECDEPKWTVDNSPLFAFQDWTEAWATEALRVLKPGGHLLAFGGSRTYHRLACAVEDAGFEIRDQMMWLYGSGFPKSLDVSKAIDKAAGAEGEVIGERTFGRTSTGQTAGWNVNHVAATGRQDVRAPATPEAERWNGWGTALKPAHEPIVVARKPLSGTVAENVLRFGTGGLNIDGCRIGIAPGDEPSAGHRTATFGTQDTVSGGDGSGGWQASAGRWPANVVLDEEAGRLLDKQSGELHSQATNRSPVSTSQGVTPFGHAESKPRIFYGLEAGGASRFFYCAKASKGERNAGLDKFQKRTWQEQGYRDNETSHLSPRAGAGRTSASANHHPTVKPIELMRYLCRLVTPLGGIVLDPFLGSGTTGCAAVLEGFDFIGIEREPEYVAICEARIAWWEKHRGEGLTDEVLKAAGVREEAKQSGQLGLLGDAA